MCGREHIYIGCGTPGVVLMFEDDILHTVLVPAHSDAIFSQTHARLCRVVGLTLTGHFQNPHQIMMSSGTLTLTDSSIGACTTAVVISIIKIVQRTVHICLASLLWWFVQECNDLLAEASSTGSFLGALSSSLAVPPE